MSAVFFACALLAAGLEWFAVLKAWRRLEYFAKPGVMIFLFAALFASTGLQGVSVWFGAGILFALAGDVFLLLANERRWFLFGLAAFVFAHLAYIVGLNIPLPAFGAIPMGVALMVIVTAMRPVRRILVSMAEKRLQRLILPVRIYASVISLTLFSALMTLFRSDWQSMPAVFVSLGAMLLVLSDLLLAWNKFVKPVRRGRLALMVTYHLGQLALIAGAAWQFSHN
jgi:uncharacterized membrane protein YhhN